MSHELSATATGSTTWSKNLVWVVLLGIVTVAILVFLMVYVYQQTPGKPLEMMQ